MSENLTVPHAPSIESTTAVAPDSSTSAAPSFAELEHGIASAPVLSLPPALHSILPPEACAMLELVGRGLAADADQPTRSAARDLWVRFAQLLAATAHTMPTAPSMPSVPLVPTESGTRAASMPAVSPMPGVPAPPIAPMSGAPVMPTLAMPSSPIAMAARALRQLSPDQLLDLALQRLRAALPPGATVSTAKGIQFSLVPVPPASGSR